MEQPPGVGDGQGQEASISITTGILVALSASWLSSLGLTIQRKSHLQNERLPQWSRRRDFRRPLWLLGFAIFITSNVLGSVFQIGALSITLLAPLGAVSLLWNAFFARILLGDVFSRYLILGTILIAGGAVLIAIFGVVPEKTHTLEELVQLYTRSSFIIWMVLQAVLLVAILTLAHWKEYSLERNLQDVYIAIPTSDEMEEPSFSDEVDHHDDELQTPPSSTVGSVGGGRHGVSSSIIKKNRKVRRWSTPPSYLALNTTATSIVDDIQSNSQTPRSAAPDASAAALQQAARTTPGSTSRSATPVQFQAERSPMTPTSRNSRHVSFGQTKYRTFGNTPQQNGGSSEPKPAGKRGFRNLANIDTSSSIQQRFTHDHAEKIRLWLGIAYGSASGTMSGLCLLFAKTGVELLILTVVGHNQFDKWQSWMIALALLFCALLQLYYLNKSLRLVGPTLICPLAFCFYNLSSIFNGLMYYDQWSRLTPLQDGLMSLGIAVLLAGVWIVSIKSPDAEVTEEMDLEECSSDDESALFSPSRRLHASDEDGRDAFLGVHGEQGDEMEGDEEEQHEETFGDLKKRMAALYQAFLLDQAGPPRGFSVGISASSPGFAIRPQYHQHNRRNTTFNVPATLRSSTTSSSSSSTVVPVVRHSHTRSDDYVASPIDGGHDLTPLRAAQHARPTEAMNRSNSAPTPGLDLEASTAIASSTRERDVTLSHRHRRKRSLAGQYYVGAVDPFAEEPVIQPDTPYAPLSPTSPRSGRSRAGSSASGARRSAGSLSVSSPMDRHPSQASSSSSNRTVRGTRIGSISRFLPWRSGNQEEDGHSNEISSDQHQH